MPPSYTIDKIKFATDPRTYEKAIALYESGKVKFFKEEINGFFATVLGTKSYQVYVDNRRYDQGDCDCYLGQNEILCKHMVAVAIRAVAGGMPLRDEDKRRLFQPVCSGQPGELSKEELATTKEAITGAIKYIKPYNGPSRLWFAYQNSLLEGCARLSKIISELPVSGQTAKLLVDLLLRLDERLSCGGVDDSDGTVGGFMGETVIALQEYAKFDSACIKAFDKLCDQSTCFGWEEPLARLFDEQGGADRLS